MKILGIIPARYASKRLPGKPLIDISGKSMIQRVYTQANKCPDLFKVVVATDDNRIGEHVRSFGGDVVMTSKKHQSGTDRCSEVIAVLDEKYDAVVNIQGDEPIISPKQISIVAESFKKPEVLIATLAKKVEKENNIFSPSTIKVVFNNHSEAIYFSRSPIPYLRNHPNNTWLSNHTFYKHIGIYGYKTSVLESISSLPQSPLEIAESLEQLRWLENGYKIHVFLTEEDAVSIDTQEDLETFIGLYAGKLD